MRRLLDRLSLRLRSLLRGAAVERAMAREIRDHIEMQAAEHIAAGMPPAEARAAAVRAFGSASRVAEQCRDTRRVSAVENLARDLRYTLRSLTRQPLLVLAATASIAVAAAASGVVFTLVSELLLSPPTVHRPDRLVYIRLGNGSHVSHPQWREIEKTGALAGLAGYQVEAEVNWTGPDRSVSLMPLLVTANFFDVTGVPVALGRGFTAGEAAADRRATVVVVSHRFWRTRLAADPAALGRTLVFNGQPYTLIGILPERLRAVPGFALAPEVYLPLSAGLMPDLPNRQAAAVQLIGRLHEEHSVEQGRAAFAAAIAQLDRANGSAEYKDVRQFAVAAGLGFEFREVGVFFALLSIAVGLVLAIACANVTGLLLSHASARRREVGVRAALGASRSRLVQQFLAEAFWIALAGTAAGVLVSQIALRLAARIQLPIPMPIELQTGPSLRVVLLALAILAITTLMSGVMPALHATRDALAPALKQDEPRYGLRRWTLRRFLVIGQVAVALVLLLAALLFVRNLTRAHDLDPGFDTTRTILAQVSFVEGRHTPESRALLLAEAVERLRARPGVTSASYSHGVPLLMRSGMTTGTELRRADRPEPFAALYHVNLVGPAYFDTMGYRMVSGREFVPGDRRGSPVVAIVNEEFARRYFPGENPVGTQLWLPGANERYAAQIVGVASNGKYRTLGEDQMPAIYEPFLQRGNRGRFVHVLVRTGEASEYAARDVERVLSSLDPTAAIEATPMRAALGFAFLPSRLGAALFGGLGLVGLVLAMVGLYATIAYNVSRRTAEIGVRMALGASARRVLGFVLGDAALLAAIGIAAGLGIALFVTQPLSAFLVSGLSAGDPLTFAATALLLFGVSLAAAVSPALRAMRIDPVRALRHE